MFGVVFKEGKGTTGLLMNTITPIFHPIYYHIALSIVSAMTMLGPIPQTLFTEMTLL